MNSAKRQRNGLAIVLTVLGVAVLAWVATALVLSYVAGSRINEMIQQVGNPDAPAVMQVASWDGNVFVVEVTVRVDGSFARQVNLTGITVNGKGPTESLPRPVGTLANRSSKTMRLHFPSAHPKPNQGITANISLEYTTEKAGMATMASSDYLLAPSADASAASDRRS